MKKEELLAFLNFLYNSTYIPIHYFEDGQLKNTYPSWSFFPEQLYIYRDSMEAQGISLNYFNTEDFLYIAIIRKPETRQDVIIGPVSTTPITEELIKSISAEYSFEESLIPDITEFFLRTPLFTTSQFFNIIGLIHKELNDEIIDVVSYFSEIDVHKDYEIGAENSNSLIERKENERYHDTYFFEQEYYGYLEKGDEAGLREFIKTIPSYTEGNIGENSIRQAKNIFITSVALATRHAIAGGLDIETAYQLSDSYIQESERMSDPHQITMLNSTAIFDFTRRVAEAKIPKGMSSDIFRSIQYISNHVNRPISVEEVASELCLDRTTLSKKFKRELGFNISTYIMRRKLEEAKSLLHFTDKSVSEISEYLCFSSQAYFQNVFKKKYGMTPKEYRKSQS